MSMWKWISSFATVLFCVSILTAAETQVNLNVGESIAERVIGQGAVFADGVLSLRGTGNVYFSKFDFDQKSGTLSFKMRHDFDNKLDNQRNKTLLRNQIYLIITLPDRTNFSVYSAGGYLRMGVFDAKGNVVVLGGATLELVKDDWNDFTISWGKKLTLSADGIKIIEKPFDGMFGGLSGKETASLRIGQRAGYSIENEFSIKDLSFGNASETIAAVPKEISDNMSQKNKKITAGNGKFSGPLKFEKLDGSNSAAVFTKTATIVYDKIDINNNSGQIDMRLCLNIDPKSDDPRLKKEWRNQIFLKLERSDRNYATLYSCLEDFRFGVFTPRGEVLFILGGMHKFEKGVWYDVMVKWGKKVEIIVNGKVIVEKEHDGLFGKLPPGDGVVTSIGVPAGFGLENEFSIDKLEVKSGSVTEQTTIAIPLVTTSTPVIDGKVDDEFWKKCSRIDGFYKFSKRDLLREKMFAYLGYTEQGILIGFESNLPGKRDAVATMNQHDAAIYNEDALELRFVAPDKSIYLFMLSPNGTKFDAYKDGIGYNPDWQAAAQRESGKWSGEILIPYKALGMPGMPAAKSEMLANFSIDMNGFFAGGCWSYTEKSYNEMKSMGKLIFSGSGQGMQLTITDLVSGQPKIEFTKVGDINPVTQLKGLIYDEKGEEVSKYNFRLSDGVSGLYTGVNLGPGLHTLVLDAKNNDGMTLLSQKNYFTTEVNTSVEVKNYPYNGFAKVEANFPSQLKKQNPEKIEFLLCDATGKTLAKDSQLIAGKNRALGQLETANLAPGDYAAVTNLYNAKGEQLDSAKAALKIFAKPVWWKNTIGLDHTVPPPWTPVEKMNNGYKVWNREYLFDNAVFPRQIKIGGKDWLRSPPKFTITVDGKKIDLLNVANKKTDTFDDKIILQSQDGSISMSGQLEFDGFFRYDLTSVKPLKVDTLSVEFPIAADFSGWYLTGTDVSNSVYRLDKSVASGFVPYLWVGSSDAGVAIVFESDEFWTSGNKNAIELIKHSNGLDCKYNIITTPKNFKQPLNLSFALMATPVKPVVTNDPFMFSRWETVTQVARPSSVVYERIAKLKPESGTLEFMFKRDANNKVNWNEMFAIAPTSRPAALPVRCYLNNSTLSLEILRKPFISGNVNIEPDTWHHFAVTYDRQDITIYCDGKKVASGVTPPDFIQACKDLASGEDTLFVGGFNPDVSYSDMIIDELRISDVVRNIETPAAELTSDANTLVLEHFEEMFRPDGFTGFTKGGGAPTIGSKFVAGRFGQGIQLFNEKVRDGETARKQDMKHEIDLYWNWHNEEGYYTEYAWPPYFTYKVRPTFKADIAKSLARGSYAMAYTIFPGVGSPSELYDQFGAEWNIEPNQVMPYGRPVGHKFSIISVSAPGYSDYMAYNIKWMLENYGLNAIYTDGMCATTRSMNGAYGAGYTDDSGRRVATTPFFGCRETVKRLYKIIKADDPKNIVINHQSFSLPIPVVSFSDAVFTGEHEDYTSVQTGALRFRGEPWGVYIFLLGASTHAWSEMHNMTPLLNGSAVYGFTMTGRRDMARKVKLIKDIYAENDYKNAQWYPWFKAEKDLLSCSDSKIHTAAYLHKGKSALLLVGNYNQNDADAKIKLNLESLGMTGKKITANNELLQLPLTVNGNEISVPVLAQKFTLVKIEAK